MTPVVRVSVIVSDYQKEEGSKNSKLLLVSYMDGPQVGGGHLDQEHRDGGDEDPVRRHHELPHGPQAVPHGQAEMLTHHSGRSNWIQDRS